MIRLDGNKVSQMAPKQFADSAAGTVGRREASVDGTDSPHGVPPRALTNEEGE